MGCCFIHGDERSGGIEVKCYRLNAYHSYVDDETLRNMEIGNLYYFLKTRMTFHKVTGCGLFL